jgi:hypothetical protein
MKDSKTHLKNSIRTHIIGFIATSLLLTLFYGLYFILTGMYYSFPKDEYYVEGVTRTRGEILIRGFANREVVIESLIISLLVAILNYFIKMKSMGLFVTAFKSAFLVTLLYYLYNLCFASAWELKERTLVLAVLSFVCSIFTVGTIDKLKKEIS